MILMCVGQGLWVVMSFKVLVRRPVVVSLGERRWRHVLCGLTIGGISVSFADIRGLRGSCDRQYFE